MKLGTAPKADKRHYSRSRSTGWTGKIFLRNPRPFRRVFLSKSFLIVLVTLLLLTNWLGYRWLFERATLTGDDVLRAITPRRMATHCRLITISEGDYLKYLGEWLQPERLERVLQTILSYEPRVLAIDIDTSQPRFRQIALDHSAPKIVWARVSHQRALRANAQGNITYEWVAGEVLGNRTNQPSYVGSPLFPQDPDWTVRGFQRSVSLADAKVPSLHWSILQAYCGAGAQQACSVIRQHGSGGSADTRVREFSANWDISRVQLSDLMISGGNTVPRSGALGDIVILCAGSGDLHPTPDGLKLGGELTAAAVEEELNHAHELTPVPSALKWLLKVLLAILIGWLNSRLTPLWAMSSMILLLAFIFVLSFVGIYYGLFRMEYLPFILGMWIEQLVDGAIHAHQHAVPA
jgi:CHASE2 domain